MRNGRMGIRRQPDGTPVGDLIGSVFRGALRHFAARQNSFPL